MNGVQEYLTYEERCEIITDICKHYSYNPYNKKKLHKRSDDELYAFRESMRHRGLLSGYLKFASIHINVLLNRFLANKYMIEEHENNTRFYIGNVTNKEDKFGQIKQYEYGYIEIDRNWRIVEVEMYGEKVKRFNGLQLIIDGKK